MKFQLLLSALILNKICVPLAATSQSSQNLNGSKRLDRSWNPKHLRYNGPVNYVRNPLRRDSYTKDTAMGNMGTDEDTSTETSGAGQAKGMDKRVPQINFYSSIPNGIGVIGQGLIWLREISAAIGTVIGLMSLPLPLWIFAIPMMLLGVALMFLPDLTTLSLPGFYPNGGGDSDPLSAFPPLFGIEGLKDLDFIQKATQLLPPNILSMKRG